MARRACEKAGVLCATAQMNFRHAEMEYVYTYHGILRPAIKDLIHDAEVLKDEILEHQIFPEIEGQLNRIIDRLSEIDTRHGDISKDKLYEKLDGVIEQIEGMKVKIETAQPNKVPEVDRKEVESQIIWNLEHLKRIRDFIT